MGDIKTHSRVNDILLGPLERPALRWLAAHMPGWVTPDLLTMLGALGALLIAASYWACRFNRGFLWLASLGFIVNWFGDSLDGTLARYRKIERPRYGFFVDHTVDTLSEVIIFLGLGLSPYLHFEVACLVLIGYLLMSVLVFVQTAVIGVFRISYARLGPTEVRVLAILVNVWVYFKGPGAIASPWGVLTGFDLVGISLAALLVTFYIATTIRQAMELARQE